MKKGSKFIIAGAAAFAGVVALSSCTASFCSTKDKAHMMFAFDYGSTAFYSSDSGNAPDGSVPLVVNGVTYTNILAYSDTSTCPALQKIVDDAEKNNITAPSINYWKAVDDEVLRLAFLAAEKDNFDFSLLVAEKDSATQPDKVDIYHDFLRQYGYIKFYYDLGSEEPNYYHTGVRWANWEFINKKVCEDTTLTIDDLPTNDFVNFYKKQMNTYITSYRSCIALHDGYYGYYGVDKNRSEIAIESKDYGYAWHRGFFEGLLIWPIAALTDLIGRGFLNMGMTAGWASIFAIIIITIIVRGLMLIATINQQTDNAKMTALQPEIAKIQAKYPNANTSQSEKMRLAEETQRLYKKHGVKPFKSILVMIIQFPVFICVWGALQGSALLSTGSFFGLNLSLSISSVLFKASSWQGSTAGVVALILFILMAVAQTFAMLLPQFYQKRQQKKVARLGKNPAANSTGRRMRIFTYIMLGMIIIMGFSLASGMGVYWLIGAIFSIIQTVITQTIQLRKKEHKKR